METQTVYQEHFGFVWRVLRRLGVSQADLPDVAHDVFMVVHRRLGTFAGNSKLTTWLFGICWRVVADRRRKQSGSEPVVNEVELFALVEPNDSDPVERREDAALLEATIAQIPAPQRTVFILFELEELELSEIAKLLGIPLGTVQSRLRLAREAFRTAATRQRARMAVSPGWKKGVCPS